MIISYSHEFVIVHIEKTGGTSIREAIAPHLPRYDLVLSNWDRYIFDNTQYYLWEHSGSTSVSRFLGDDWDRYKKFSTVRNPVEILKSAYKYGKNIYNAQFKEIKDISHMPPDGVLKGYLYSEKTGTGPDGFVEFMLSRGIGTVAPQVEKLEGMLDGMIVDLSRLDDSWKSVLDYLGLDASIKLGHENAYHSSDIVLSDRSIGFIKSHFARDYDTLPSITGVDWN